MVTKEKDEELTLFTEMKKNKDRNVTSPGQNIRMTMPSISKTTLIPLQKHSTAADRFLNSENEKSEYSWLMTPPSTPQVPLSDSQGKMANQIMSNARVTSLQSRLINAGSKENMMTSTVRAMPSSQGLRSLTPTPRPSNRSNPPGRSSTPIKPIARSSTPTNRGVSRTSTPTRSHPTQPKHKWKPNEMPGFSLQTPPNLRTTVGRSASVTRGRSTSLSEAGQEIKQSRQSCSPVRKGRPRKSNEVNPVQMGTKMVEMVVNMRKLAPPRNVEFTAEGFGRSLSKKSLDMAIRHMDIRRSMSDNLRPLMTRVPASSLYSVRSRGGNSSCSHSPHAIRSVASSESSLKCG